MEVKPSLNLTASVAVLALQGTRAAECQHRGGQDITPPLLPQGRQVAMRLIARRETGKPPWASHFGRSAYSCAFLVWEVEKAWSQPKGNSGEAVHPLQCNAVPLREIM